MSQPIRGQGCHLVFLICLKNTNLVEDVEILLPVNIEIHAGVSEEKSTMSLPIKGCGSHLVFPIGQKYPNWYRMLRSCFLSNFVEFH